MDLSIIIIASYLILVMMFYTNTATFYSRLRIGIMGCLFMLVSLIKLWEVMNEYNI